MPASIVVAAPQVGVGSPPGSVETIASPPLSTATQSDVVGHETPVSWRPGTKSICCAVQVGAGSPGLREYTAKPVVFTATHKDADAHETSVKTPGASASVHTGATAVGFLLVMTWPASSTATHSVSVGHDAPVSLLVPWISTSGLHVGSVANGSADTATPLLSARAATHSDWPAHASLSRFEAVGANVQLGVVAVMSVVAAATVLPSVTHPVAVGHETLL